jgi:micrococcal nuclease
MRKMLTAFVITSFLSMGVAHAEKICSVQDGDTLKLCNGQKIQLFGINAPEVQQPFGPDAREHLKAMVIDKEVDISGCMSRGWYRKMCNVTMSGKDLQAEMVKMGYAFDFSKYSGGKYQQLQNEAKQGKMGMWVQSEGNLEIWDVYHKER